MITGSAIKRCLTYCYNSEVPLMVKTYSYLLNSRFVFLIGYQMRFRTLVNQFDTCCSSRPVFLASISLWSYLTYGCAAFFKNQFRRMAACFLVKFDFLKPLRLGFSSATASYLVAESSAFEISLHNDYEALRSVSVKIELEFYKRVLVITG